MTHPVRRSRRFYVVRWLLLFLFFFVVSLLRTLFAQGLPAERVAGAAVAAAVCATITPYVIAKAERWKSRRRGGT